MNRKGQVTLVLIVLLGLIVGLVGYGAMTYNKLVRLHEQVPAAWAQVENVLQRRNDLIPNLVNTVKGFAKQEQVIYGQISQALQSFSRAQTIPDKIAADSSITGLLSRIMAISVNYPKLQSNENFLHLQDELAGTENRIAVERMRFNETVQTYNSLVKTFPTNIIARIGGFTPSETYFKADGSRAYGAARSASKTFLWTISSNAIKCLDLEPGAPAESVRRSYIELTHVWDPERYVNNAVLRTRAEQKRKEIDEAYQAIRAFLPELQNSSEGAVEKDARPERDFTELSMDLPVESSRHYGNSCRPCSCFLFLRWLFIF